MPTDKGYRWYVNNIVTPQSNPSRLTRSKFLILESGGPANRTRRSGQQLKAWSTLPLTSVWVLLVVKFIPVVSIDYCPILSLLILITSVRSPICSTISMSGCGRLGRPNR